jgi:hypothetical protein
MDIGLKKVICLTPVYNDWESFSILVDTIKNSFSIQNKYTIEIVAVNDGSVDKNVNGAAGIPIEIVNLKVNVGHQRAIAIGLQYIADKKLGFDYVVVLDSDGEDRPEDIVSLISKSESLNDEKIIFAQRKKRSESLFFKIGYFFYKHIFYGLTGHKINFGNFSCIPERLLKRVVFQENLWNHYSGSIIQSKTPFEKVLLDRGKRYAGYSKMNFTSLILHGLSSISVYFDSLSVRILKLSLFGVALCFFAVIYILWLKIFTDQSIPGWASSLILIIFGIILQLFSVTLIVLLLQLSSRKRISAPNTKIYLDFIESIENGQIV